MAQRINRTANPPSSRPHIAALPLAPALQMLGEDAVRRTSDSGYAIEPRFQQPTPIRSILTREQRESGCSLLGSVNLLG